MVLRNLIFISLAILISGSASLEIKDLYNINAVSQYVKKIHTDTLYVKLLEKSSLTNDEKYGVLQGVFDHMVAVLDQLNATLSNSQGDFWPSDLPKLLEMFDVEKIKNNFFPPSLLSLFTGKINEKLATINVHVDSILDLKDKFFTNAHDYCAFVPKLLAIVNTDNRLSYEGVEKEYVKLIDNIVVQMKDGIQHKFCHKSTSLHQGIYDYFRQVMTAYLKKSVMIYHLNVIDGRCLDEDKTSWMLNYMETVVSNYWLSISQTRSTLRSIKHSMFRCDPQFSTEDRRETHYELEKMIQTVIIKEEDLTTDKSCSHNCDLEDIKSTIDFSECADYRDCRYIEGSYEICEANPGSSRLYQWFYDEAGVLYGDNSTDDCSKGLVEKYSKLSFWKFRWCDYCVCTCVKKPSFQREVIASFSFRSQVSDISKDLVVVGLRFIKKEHTIHVQIKEGKIKPKRFEDFGVWKETETIFYDYWDKSLFVIEKDDTRSIMQLGIDYAVPTSISCEDVLAPEGFAVTGIRFRFADDVLQGMPKKVNGTIQLQIRVTPFDYVTGKLKDLKLSKWIGPESKTRSELVLNKPDLPTKSSVNILDSKNGHFIKFTVSDLEKDAGQSTVPFFDAQDAEEQHEGPLGGIGIIHRGQEGFGGFLAFRVYGLDLAPQFNSDYDV